MQIIPAGYLHFSSFFAIIHKVNSCARSEVGLSRLPVTEEIAGSNPVGRAKINHSPKGWVIYFDASGGSEPAIGALAP